MQQSGINFKAMNVGRINLKADHLTVTWKITLLVKADKFSLNIWEVKCREPLEMR